jgi:hypothetical protein
LTWVKPDEGWLKVNMDADLDKKVGGIGFGIIVCDHEGKVLATKSISRMGSWEQTAAEALAAYYGTIFCQEKGCHRPTTHS